MEFREGLLYTESHEWVKEEGDTMTIGISDYAQCQMKDVVYVEMPEIGQELKKGDSIGTVESVKTVADIYSPVSGKVVETNLALKDHPQLINEDPFGKGWIVKIAVRDRKELKDLLSAKDYKKSLPEE